MSLWTNHRKIVMRNLFEFFTTAPSGHILPPHACGRGEKKTTQEANPSPRLTRPRIGEGLITIFSAKTLITEFFTP